MSITYEPTELEQAEERIADLEHRLLLAESRLRYLCEEIAHFAEREAELRADAVHREYGDAYAFGRALAIIQIIAERAARSLAAQEREQKRA